MTERFEEFVLNFFRKIKCNVADDGIGYTITNVPKSFLDILKKNEPLKISFNLNENYDFIDNNSQILKSIEKYLESAGRTTLLKIDFEVNPEEEIRKNINLKNCEINNIEKKHINNFFTRISFLSVFNYLNEREQVLNEIYIHNKKVVLGDLSGYKIVEGSNTDIQLDKLKDSYDIAKEELKKLLESKTTEIGNNLSLGLNKELNRISEYYNIRLSELGGDLSKQIERIEELELELRICEDGKKEDLKTRIEKLKKGLLKIGTDDAKERILKEKEFSIQNAKQKFSLNITNKVINTTIIYYPIYDFKLILKSDVKKNPKNNNQISHIISINYDPLTKELSGLFCDNCNKKLNEVLLCSSGHVVCESCLERCGDCGKLFCKKCLTKICSTCGKKLCKDCFKICPKCGKYICSNCTRKDCVTGEEICLNCLRACSRCHGLTQEKYFGISLNGSKICQKCLAEESRNKIIKRIFE